MEGFLVKRLHWIPLMFSGVLCIGTFISFGIALERKAISIYFPFISETGGTSPESCVFTLALTLGSFLGIFVVLIRYLTIIDDGNINDDLLSLNTKAMYIGFLSMLGLMIVASFPMKFLLSIHLVGAGIHFVMGMVYLALQTYLSYRLSAGKGNSKLAKIRVILGIITLLFLILLVITYPIGHYIWSKSTHDHDRSRKTPDDKGFAILLIASICEWIMCASFLTYFATFFEEFRKFHWVTLVKRTDMQQTSVNIS